MKGTSKTCQYVPGLTKDRSHPFPSLPTWCSTTNHIWWENYTDNWSVKERVNLKWWQTFFTILNLYTVYGLKSPSISHHRKLYFISILGTGIVSFQSNWFLSHISISINIVHISIRVQKHIYIITSYYYYNTSISIYHIYIHI